MEAVLVDVQNDKNLSVVHSNVLTEARYSLTPGEQKIMLLLISMISKNDVDFKDYEMRVSDFARIMEINSKNIYGRLKDTLEKLASRTLFIPKKTGFLVIGWISSAEYIEGEGIIQLSFDKKLKPHLLQLKNKFTKYGLLMATQFKSSYTIRIYMLLKQYESIGKREFSVDELRIILDIEKSKYPKFYEFKRRIINQAKKEFDKKDKETGLYLSDINFKLETIRSGRKISHLRFTIIKQQTKETLNLPIKDPEGSKSQTEEKKPTLKNFNENQTFQTIKLLGIREKKALELFEEYGEETIKEKIDVLQEMQEVKEIKSPSGFIIKALKEDYQSKKTIDKTESKQKKQKDKKERNKKKIESLKNDLDREFGKMARENFLFSRTEEQKEELKKEIINGLEGGEDNMFAGIVKKDLGDIKIAALLNKHIPNFEADKQTYIQEKLKEKGLIKYITT